MSTLSIAATLFLASTPVWPVEPQVTVTDVVVYEPPRDGVGHATFRVRIWGAITGERVLDYWTADGTAGHPQDYAETRGQLSFGAGRNAYQEATVSVPIHHDGQPEPQETFHLRVAFAGELPVAAEGTARIRPVARGDISGDGRSDVLILRVHDDGCSGSGELIHINREIDTWAQPIIPGTAALPVAPSPLSPEIESGAWRSVATGDFDGDGLPDVFWERWIHTHLRPPTHQERDAVIFTRTTSERVYQAPGGGEGGEPPAAGFTAVGSGDFASLSGPALRPDGRADLLWYDAAARNLVLWVSDGAGFPERRVFDGIVGATPSAVADLDGDGFSEIVWQSVTDGEGPSHFFAQALGGGPRVELPVAAGADAPDLGLVLVAAGDFDADGSDDLLWKHGETEDLSAWLMNGGELLQVVPVTPPLAGQSPSSTCDWWAISGPR